MNEFCNPLISADILKMAGITKNNKAIFTFESNGTKIDVIISSIYISQYEKSKFLSQIPKYARKYPISKQKMDKNYWFRYIEQKNIMYFKYIRILFWQFYKGSI